MWGGRDPGSKRPTLGQADAVTNYGAGIQGVAPTICMLSTEDLSLGTVPRN
jgi:hypothetical protein